MRHDPLVDRPAADMETLTLGPFDRHGTTRTRFRGRVIEVEHGIPGETVEAEIEGGKRPRGHIVTVLDPSPERVVAPCQYFREWSCGGCQWQMLSYQGQLRFKRDEVNWAMRSEGLTLEVGEIHHLDDPWRYRSTAGIALGKRAGFRRHASLAIVPIRDCPISHPSIGKLMAALNDGLERGTVPDFRGRVRVEVLVAEGPEGERVQTLVRPTEANRPAKPDEIERLTAVLEAIPEVDNVTVQAMDGTIANLYGQEFALTTIAGRAVSLAAGSFFQTNLQLVPRLIDRLREAAEPLAGKRVADVYAGVGIFGLFLAGEAAEVAIVETDPLAVDAAQRTATLWELDNVRFFPQRAEEVMAEVGGYEVVIVDPPRSGLSEAVRASLAETRPPTILYVSCLAESLARDLRSLIAAGYHVESLELFDFYPQTYHVELLAVLKLLDLQHVGR